MSDLVIFHLRRVWEGKNLYEEIKGLRKTSEWRDLSKYWVRRLCIEGKSLDGKTLVRTADFFIGGDKPQDLTEFLKVHRAWFVEGYPKGSLPRLEAEITGLVYHPSSSQLEIKFKLIREVMTYAMAYAQKHNRELGRIVDQNRKRQTDLIFAMPKDPTGCVCGKPAIIGLFVKGKSVCKNCFLDSLTFSQRELAEKLLANLEKHGLHICGEETTKQ